MFPTERALEVCCHRTVNVVSSTFLPVVMQPREQLVTQLSTPLCLKGQLVSYDEEKVDVFSRKGFLVE